MRCFAFIIGMNEYYIIQCDDQCKAINAQTNLTLVLHLPRLIFVMMNAKQFKDKQNYCYFCVYNWCCNIRNANKVIIKYGLFLKTEGLSTSHNGTLRRNKPVTNLVISASIET